LNCLPEAGDSREVFTAIYRKNAWGGKESVSGTGSDSAQTRVVVREISAILTEFDVSSMLDIPCGDFNWMKDVKLENVHYTGADIVGDLVAKNTARYARAGVSFRILDVLGDALPRVDLVLCRDCLVHFSERDVFLALRNICRNDSKFLITTTFTGRERNVTIATGEWRPLNLQAAPFSLPEPLRIVHEGCMEFDGAFRDKALALWRISDISTCVENALCSSRL
jgi:2-polyprenyl-3-methyl-5-hydroxy-6-metoxy-1,4-benzoquinol methylase